MKSKIWDFWAKHYHKLWVQKYSLGPTRNKVKKLIEELDIKEEATLLDIGCGVGELLYELQDINNIKRHGLDFSEKMIEISKLKNPKVTHYKLDVSSLDKIEARFNIITCTHSLPYYNSKRDILKQINELLKDEGRVIFAFASGNTFLDRFILLFVKLTTGPASYPSDKEFKMLIKDYFDIEKREVIKLRPYMPTIAVYSLRKVEK